MPTQLHREHRTAAQKNRALRERVIDESHIFTFQPPAPVSTETAEYGWRRLAYSQSYAYKTKRSFGHSLQRSVRRLHLRKIFDLLEISLSRKDVTRAFRALRILLLAREFRPDDLWRYALEIASLGPQDKYTHPSESQRQEASRRLKFFRTLATKRGRALQVQIYIEMIPEMIVLGLHREALDNIEILLISWPYRSEPIIHLYSALLFIYCSVQHLPRHPKAEAYQNHALYEGVSESDFRRAYLPPNLLALRDSDHPTAVSICAEALRRFELTPHVGVSGRRRIHSMSRSMSRRMSDELSRSRSRSTSLGLSKKKRDRQSTEESGSSGVGYRKRSSESRTRSNDGRRSNGSSRGRTEKSESIPHAVSEDLNDSDESELSSEGESGRETGSGSDEEERQRIRERKQIEEDAKRIRPDANDEWAKSLSRAYISVLSATVKEPQRVDDSDDERGKSVRGREDDVELSLDESELSQT